MRKLLLVMLAVLLFAETADAAEIVYSLGEASHYYGTGQSRNETYDVALRIADPSLVGCRVKGVRIQFSSVDGISASKAWMSESIGVKSQKFTGADIETVEFNATAGVNEVSFTSPYVITTDGLYVGYSLTAAKDVATKPILLASSTSGDGFYIHTSGLYRTAWHNVSAESGDLALEVVLDGDFADHAATALNVPVVNALTNSTNKITFDILNQGLQGISSVDYCVEVGGQKAEYHTDLPTALPGYYGRRTWLTANLPLVAEAGSYDLHVTLTRVNGHDNLSSHPTGTGRGNFYDALPVKRPVCEEFTGLWCQWCPRGFVGMEMMGEKYGSDFVGICYHNDDPMEIMPSTSFPANVSGFPSADVDRVAVIDPNFESLQAGWLYQRDQFAPLSVDVETEIEGDNFKVTALITSPIDLDNDRYQLQFIVTHDGMHQPSWQQTNAYANRDDLRDGYMDWFCDQGTYVSGLVYNDVIIAWSGKAPVPGSLPTHFDRDVTERYTYTFDLNEAVTTYSVSKGQSLVQDRSKLKGVVLVIDTTTGEIVNANQAYSNSSTITGLRQMATSRDDVVSHVGFFDLHGRRVVNPHSGLFVKTETTRSGKVITRRVVMK